jgi:hypothetical protein
MSLIDICGKAVCQFTVLSKKIKTVGHMLFLTEKESFCINNMGYN